MNGTAHLLAQALYALGVLIVVASAVGAAAMRRTYNRLHFLTPATSLGGPLIGAALGISNGWGLTTAADAFVIALLALTGPVLEAATGRVAAQREGLIDVESPQ